MTRSWLPLHLIEPALPLMEAWGVSEVARSPRGFLTAYKAVDGQHHRLSAAWVDRRNAFLARHYAQVEAHSEPLWTADGLPTRRHLALVAWAWTPEREKWKRWLGQLNPARSKQTPRGNGPSIGSALARRAKPDVPFEIRITYGREIEDSAPIARAFVSGAEVGHAQLSHFDLAAHPPSDDDGSAFYCRQDVRALKKIVGPATTWVMWRSSLAKEFKGRGIGVKLYEALLTGVAEHYGKPAIIFPEACLEDGSTSKSAQRVWVSLRKRWLSSGDAIASVPLVMDQPSRSKEGQPTTDTIYYHCGARPPGAPFSLEHAGTGEGRLTSSYGAGGAGIYFASVEAVARAYCAYTNPSYLSTVTIRGAIRFDYWPQTPGEIQRLLSEGYVGAGKHFNQRGLKHGSFTEIVVYDPSAIVDVNQSAVPARSRAGTPTCPPDTLVFYHGAQRWEGPPSVVEHRKGHAEHGPGIYLTTSWETANKYAKGGGSVYRVGVDPSIRFAGDVSISADDARAFVKGLTRLRGKAEILASLTRVEERRGSMIPADYLVNTFVNQGVASGQNGPLLAAFLAQHGVDASLISHSVNEDWIVVFNPGKVCMVEKLDPKQVSRPGFAFDLPKVPRTPARSRQGGMVAAHTIALELVQDAGGLMAALQALADSSDAEVLYSVDRQSAPAQAVRTVLEGYMPDELPRSADMITVYHATDKDSAARLLADGVIPSLKPRSLARTNYANGHPATYAPKAGLDQGLYVGASPRHVEGYGLVTLALTVPRSFLEVPPESTYARAWDALHDTNGAVIRRPIPPSAIQRYSVGPARPRPTGGDPVEIRVVYGEEMEGSEPTAFAHVHGETIGHAQLVYFDPNMPSDDDGEYAFYCLDDVSGLQHTLGTASTWILRMSRVDTNFRDTGIGVQLYEALLTGVAEHYGMPAIIFPESCQEGGSTSTDAQRVWASLRKRWMSSGQAIASVPLAQPVRSASRRAKDAGMIDGTWGRAGSGILVTDGQRLLLLQRSSSVQDPHLWSIPGGAIPEVGGQPIDAWKSAQKETREELGGALPAGRVLGKYTYRKPGSSFTYTTFLWGALPEALNRLRPRLNWEHDDWRLVTFDEVEELDLHPGVSWVFEQMRDGVRPDPVDEAPLAPARSQTSHVGTSTINPGVIQEAEELSAAMVKAKAANPKAIVSEDVKMPEGYIGIGSDRVVYVSKADPSVVIKVGFREEANLDEAAIWEDADAITRECLVPVLAHDPRGRWLIMPFVEEADGLDDTRCLSALKQLGFLDLGDWNFAQDGRALDYAEPFDLKAEQARRANPVGVDFALNALKRGDHVDTERAYRVGSIPFDAEKGAGGTPNSRNVNYLGFVVWIRPSEFLALCPPPETHGIGPRIEAWQVAISKGLTLSPPMLYVTRSERDPNEFQVTDHEGRHRTIVAKLRSDEPFPVQVFPSRMRARDFASFDFRTMTLTGHRRGLRVRPAGVALNGVFDPLGAAADPLSVPKDIPQRVVEEYSYGRCMWLAVALHERFGWPIYAEIVQTTTGAEILHAYVKHPSGQEIDILGPQGSVDHFGGSLSTVMGPLSSQDLATLGHFELNPERVKAAVEVMNEYVVPRLRAASINVAVPEQPSRSHVALITDWPLDAGAHEIKIGPTTLLYGVGPKGLHLSSLRTPTRARRSGHATRAIQLFTKMADQKGLPITLCASPLDRATSLGRLVAFYRRFGFEVDGRRSCNALGHPWMHREPIQAAQPARNRLGTVVDGLPPGYAIQWFDGEDDGELTERIDRSARALARKVNVGILRAGNVRQIVRKGPKVVGALFDSLGGHYSFDIVVDPEHQGRGIGRWLIDSADTLAQEYEGEGYTTYLEAVNPNIVQPLVTRGFTVVGTEGHITFLQRGPDGEE